MKIVIDDVEREWLQHKYNTKLDREGSGMQSLHRRPKPSYKKGPRLTPGEYDEIREKKRMRAHRAGYVTIEGQQTEDGDALIIRPDDVRDAAPEPAEAAEPMPRPTFEEAHAAASIYPNTPREVPEYNRRKMIIRRRRRRATEKRKEMDAML